MRPVAKASLPLQVKRGSAIFFCSFDMTSCKIGYPSAESKSFKLSKNSSISAMSASDKEGRDDSVLFSKSNLFAWVAKAKHLLSRYLTCAFVRLLSFLTKATAVCQKSFELS